MNTNWLKYTLTCLTIMLLTIPVNSENKRTLSLTSTLTFNFKSRQNSFLSQFFNLEGLYNQSQLIKVSQIQSYYKKKFIALRKAMLPHKKQFYFIISRQNVSLKKAKSELQKIAHYRVKLRMEMLKMRLDMEKTLKKE